MFKKLVLLTLCLGFATEVLATSETRRFLLSSLQTRNSEAVKVASIKALRDFAGQNDVERALLNLIQNNNELLALRQAAVETLVPFTRSSNLSRRIVALYTRETNVEMKKTILRSLWLAASSNNTTERFLTNVLHRELDQELRQAAAFGLMATITSTSKAQNMLNILRNRTLNTNLRVEALKSLFFWRNNRVENVLEALAYDKTEDSAVRAACLKLYMSYPQSSSKRRYLMNLSRVSTNEQVKVAATDALRVQINQEDVRFFHLYKNPKTGELRNPLLD